MEHEKVTDFMCLLQILSQMQLGFWWLHQVCQISAVM